MRRKSMEMAAYARGKNKVSQNTREFYLIDLSRLSLNFKRSTLVAEFIIINES